MTYGPHRDPHAVLRAPLPAEGRPLLAMEACLLRAAFLRVPHRNLVVPIGDDLALGEVRRIMADGSHLSTGVVVKPRG